MSYESAGNSEFPMKLHSSVYNTGRLTESLAESIPRKNSIYVDTRWQPIIKLRYRLQLTWKHTVYLFISKNLNRIICFFILLVLGLKMEKSITFPTSFLRLSRVLKCYDVHVFQSQKGCKFQNINKFANVLNIKIKITKR